MDDDNIFDEDDALDCIIYEEITNDNNQKDNKSGCLSSIVLFIIPLSSLLYNILVL